MRTYGKLIRLALVLVTLPLAACETPTRVIDTAVASFKPIPYSGRDTCETQRAVAEHNAVYDTLKTGKPVTYRPPCELPGKKPDVKQKPVAARPDDVRHEFDELDNPRVGRVPAMERRLDKLDGWTPRVTRN